MIEQLIVISILILIALRVLLVEIHYRKASYRSMDDVYERFPYDVFDFRKWTFKQFFPEF